MTSGADCAPQPSSWSGRTPKRTPADAVGLKLGASEDRATAAAARFDPLLVWSVRHGADADRPTMHRRRNHLDWTVATPSRGRHKSVRSVRALSIRKAPPGRLPAMVGGPGADPRLRQSNCTVEVCRRAGREVARLRASGSSGSRRPALGRNATESRPSIDGKASKPKSIRSGGRRFGGCPLTPVGPKPNEREGPSRGSDRFPSQ